MVRKNLKINFLGFSLAKAFPTPLQKELTIIVVIPMYKVYVLECADGTLYTGWTNNLDRRLAAHNDGTASKYTRSRTPVALRITFDCEDKIDACSLEYWFKTLTRKEKIKIIDKCYPLDPFSRKAIIDTILDEKKAKTQKR